MSDNESEGSLDEWIKNDTTVDRDFDRAMAGGACTSSSAPQWEACAGMDAITSAGEDTRARAFQEDHRRKHTVGQSGAVLAQAAAAADFVHGAHASALNLVDGVMHEHEAAATRIQARFRGGRTRRQSRAAGRKAGRPQKGSPAAA